MKSNSGEVVTLILVGLAIGTVATIISGNRWAQQRANTLGAPVGLGAYVSENPVQAIAYPVIGAAAGWGISALTEREDERAEPQPIYISSGRDSTIVITGRDGSASNTQRQEWIDD